MADQKITQLTALTTPATADLLAIVDDPGGTPETKKITLGDIGLGVKATVLLDSTLGGSAASFSVTGIGTYDWITILAGLRSDRAASTGDDLRIYFNNDTTAANYRSGYHYELGGASGANVFDAPYLGGCPGSTAVANSFAFVKVKIFDPSNAARFKVALWENGNYQVAGSTIIAAQGTVAWESTAAITRIDIDQLNGPNFIAGSRCIMIGYRLV